MRITWAAKSGSDQEQATGRTSTVSADQAGCHAAHHAGPGGRGTAGLMPQIGGTAGRMPRVDGTCLTCDGNGHQALDQQGNHPGRGALGALRPSQLSCLIEVEAF